VREKIIAVARKTMASERAQNLSKETGALIYWMDADDATKRIEKDIAVTNTINEMIAE
jgi:hypothetical protein